MSRCHCGARLRVVRYVSQGYDKPPLEVWGCPICDGPGKVDLSEPLPEFPMPQPKDKQ